MSEPQLSVRSTKARDLAHSLAKRTGQPINKLVERALERYDGFGPTKVPKVPRAFGYSIESMRSLAISISQTGMWFDPFILGEESRENREASR